MPLHARDRDPVGGGHRRLLDERTLDRGLPEECHRVAAFGILFDDGLESVGDFLVKVPGQVTGNKVGPSPTHGIATESRQVLHPVTRSIHGDGKVGDVICAFRHIPGPFKSRRQKPPLLLSTRPEHLPLEGARGRCQDLGLMLSDPFRARGQRKLVHLVSIEVGELDRQPEAAPVSERFAPREFEECPAHILGLGLDLPGNGIGAGAKIDLVGKVEDALPQRPRDRQSRVER